MNSQFDLNLLNISYLYILFSIYMIKTKGRVRSRKRVKRVKRIMKRSPKRRSFRNNKKIKTTKRKRTRNKRTKRMKGGTDAVTGTTSLSEDAGGAAGRSAGAGTAGSTMFDSLKDLSFEEFRETITELYQSPAALTLEIETLSTECIDKGFVDAGFEIKRIQTPGAASNRGQGVNRDDAATARPVGGTGIFTDPEGNIIKMLCCYESAAENCKRRFFVEEIFWMKQLYKDGISPEFISVDFIKLKSIKTDRTYIHSLSKLKRHETFKEYYIRKAFDPIATGETIKATIMGDDSMCGMFTELLAKCDNFKYDVTSEEADLHLNNVVMNLPGTGLLLIDTIPKTGGQHTANNLEGVSFEFS
jgi:hypothetical protein